MSRYYNWKELSIGEIPFKFKDETQTEKFSLWSVKEAKFIREGEKVMTEKGEQEVTKYIKLSDEEKVQYRRVLKVIRNLLIEGEEFLVDFPISVNGKAIDLFNSIESLGLNPLDKSFKVTREGEGINTTYKLEVLGETSGDTDSPNLQLEPIEQKLVDSLKTNEYSHYTKEQKISVISRNLVNIQEMKESEAKTRATEIVERCF